MLMCQGYDNHNCHNIPQIGNGVGVWMTSYPEAMGWEFGNFEKDISWELISGHVRQTILCLPLGIENWILCHGVESWKVDLGHVDRQWKLCLDQDTHWCILQPQLTGLNKLRVLNQTGRWTLWDNSRCVGNRHKLKTDNRTNCRSLYSSSKWWWTIKPGNYIYGFLRTCTKALYMKK